MPNSKNTHTHKHKLDDEEAKMYYSMVFQRRVQTHKHKTSVKMGYYSFIWIYIVIAVDFLIWYITPAETKKKKKKKSSHSV